MTTNNSQKHSAQWSDLLIYIQTKSYPWLLCFTNSLQFCLKVMLKSNYMTFMPFHSYFARLDDHAPVFAWILQDISVCTIEYQYFVFSQALWQSKMKRHKVSVIYVHGLNSLFFICFYFLFIYVNIFGYSSQVYLDLRNYLDEKWKISN